MGDEGQIHLTASAGTLPGALTLALRQIITWIASPGAVDTLTGTIHAEATTASGLLPRLTESLTGLIGDFEAKPADISIDGLRWLDGTVRVWGTVTLSRERLTHSINIEWLEAPTVDQEEDVWRIEGQAIISMLQRM